MTADLETLLDRAARRLSLRARLARAAWLALAAIVSVELGALAARGVGAGVLLAGESAGALLGLAALGALLAGKRASRIDAARELDAALGRGALLETAAEALAERHGALGGLAIGEARRASADVLVARLIPIEAPRGLWLAGGAALLLLALAVGPASEGAGVHEPRVVWDPATTGAGNLTTAPTAAPSPGASTIVARPDVSGSPASAGVPSPPLDPALARALAARLKELAARLATRPGTGTKGETDDEAKARADLEAALAKGDEAAARRALERLEARGTKDSADAIQRAADELARGGDEGARGKTGDREGSRAGQGSEPGPSPSHTPSGIAGEPAPTGDVPGSARGARVPVPWRVVAAQRRYLESLEEARGGS